MRQPGRKSKIVCTLGPAVHSYEAISELIRRGMDVARLNFSHGNFDNHRQTAEWIRKASSELNIEVGILGDLQGPKIRTGTLVDSDNSTRIPFIKLKAEHKLCFVGSEPGSKPAPGNGTEQSPIAISYPRLAGDLKVGDALLFDDGIVKFTVTQVDVASNRVWTQLVNGSRLGENKGCNMPGAKLSGLGITEKDWEDIQFALELKIDFLALSFVRSAREVKSLKQFLKQKGSDIQVISKIEKQEAIDDIDEILAHSDALMVARGDLGVEIGNENVTIVQKMLIKKCLQAGKPVITATQMLMSMVENPSPSRAEASDVANAVIDGSDALMLSNETATGNYPFESVTTMAQIIVGAETLGSRPKIRFVEGESLPVPEAIDYAASQLAVHLKARGIACLTRSGLSARLLAKHRPRTPIFAFAENARVRSQLCLSWGVNVITWKEMKAQDHNLFDELMEELSRLGLIRENDLVVMTAGIPTSQKAGSTNTIVVKALKRKSSL